MPPKSKSKKVLKGKSSAVVDGLSTDEMSKDQLEEHIVRLREELDREREERSYFQLERDKVQAFWEISKRNLEETQAELRSKRREREEAEERHRVEITVYKQKLKHVLSEQHEAVSELKIDGVSSTALIQNQHAESELRLRRDAHALQADVRERELHNQDCIKELKLKHQVELMELTNDYDKRVREIEERYHRKMQSMTEAENKKRRAEVMEIEEQMRERVVTLTADHDRTYRSAEEYYSGVQSRLLAEQKELKEELAELKKQQARADSDLLAALQENKSLRESLLEAEQQLPKLHKQLEDHEEAKAERAVSRARVKKMETELRDLGVQHELLLKAFMKVEGERDELLQKQTQLILDVQQKSGMKELLLEKKLSALSETLETTDAQLCGAVSAAGADYRHGAGCRHAADQAAADAAVKKLQEMREAKQAAINKARYDADRDFSGYSKLLLSCQESMKNLRFPLYEPPLRHGRPRKKPAGP
ncbi:dynein regulatory complex subunit 4-like [Scomber japonicus]|uniref:dynein regulatory complex subunit 4-like n=1 Tax=Scomber japonicus TaxID=13676 RepID=UPI0023056E21|nr:dynein regulatory complex subunit 4-like [Scomber japonicus]